MTPEMLMADGVRFGLLRDWLSDLPDDYCLAIWRERVRRETGDPEGDPYCVRLVSGDPLNQQEREALASAPTLNEALSKACDSTMSDEALREVAEYEAGAALPAEHAPPDPEIFAALRDLEALVRDFQSTHDYTEWWDNSPEVIRARDILNRESAVGSRPALAGSPDLTDESLAALLEATADELIGHPEVRGTETSWSLFARALLPKLAP